jgi:hypothetical protein
LYFICWYHYRLRNFFGLYNGGNTNSFNDIISDNIFIVSSNNYILQDIIEIVKSITKYSVTIEDVKMVQYELDKAISIALKPPFGPVWVNLPACIGSSQIKEKDFIKLYFIVTMKSKHSYLNQGL